MSIDKKIIDRMGGDEHLKMSFNCPFKETFTAPEAFTNSNIDVDV